MGDTGDAFREMRLEGQQKRARNRRDSAIILKQRGVRFEVKNDGAHLIIKSSKGLIDFWPGTGRWTGRNGKRGFGIRNLLKYLFSTKHISIPSLREENSNV